jgi:hypothetical protein
MIAPAYTLVSGSGAVQAVFGNPVRVYGFGEAAQNVAKPYAVWQTIVGLPENYLGRVPDIDQHSTQVDVYGSTSASVIAAATALRNVYEVTAHMTSFRLWPKETDTNLFRVTLEIDFWTKR